MNDYSVFAGILKEYLDVALVPTRPQTQRFVAPNAHLCLRQIVGVHGQSSWANWRKV